MSSVEIYSTPTCPFCIAAKRLLDKKNVSYKDIDVSRDPSKRAAMTQRANGGRTVPQIFINNRSIGGSDELHSLERQGKLDALLAS